MDQSESEPRLVFVSYSSTDGPLVRYLVRFLRAAGVSAFRDEDSLEFGSDWKAEITMAIDRCHTMLVFWCSHSACSTEVQSEYTQALGMNTKVVPVMVDYTSLPPELARHHGVDLRPVVGASHNLLLSALRSEEESRGVSARMTNEGYRRWLEEQAVIGDLKRQAMLSFSSQLKDLL